jgi:hypothetical protein
MTSETPKQVDGPTLQMSAMPVDKVAAMAGQKGVTVYKYTHDAPEGRMNPQHMAEALRDICAAFDDACRAQRNASNEALREQVLRGNDTHRQFQHFYPKVFADVTVRVLTPAMETALEKARKLYMLYMVELWQGKGTEEEKAARAMTIATRLSMRDTTDADRSGPFTTRLEDIPEAARTPLPSLTPLDVSTFGGRVINQ